MLALKLVSGGGAARNAAAAVADVGSATCRAEERGAAERAAMRGPEMRDLAGMRRGRSHGPAKRAERSRGAEERVSGA
jgi:hypothetical protein